MQVDQMLQYHLVSEGAVFNTGHKCPTKHDKEVEPQWVQKLRQTMVSFKTTVVVCESCLWRSALLLNPDGEPMLVHSSSFSTWRANKPHLCFRCHLLIYEIVCGLKPFKFIVLPPRTSVHVF